MQGNIFQRRTSDELAGARNKSNVQYGEERLSSLIGNRNGVSPRELIGACLENLTDFLSGIPKTDDLTMMVVRRAG